MTLSGRSLLASLAALAVAGGALAGCAAAGAGQSPAVPTTSSATPVGSTSGGAAVIGPVIVEPGQTEATAAVGRTVVINSSAPDETVISTDRPDLLEVMQGSYDGSAWFNPGAVALAPGQATITVEHGGASRTIAITITPAAR